MTDSHRQPISGHTPTPWSPSLDGKTIMGNGGENFVVYASATATCGRPTDDYYGCQRAKAEVRLSIKPRDIDLIVAAVNSYASNQERIKELEEALRFYYDEWQSNGDGDSETPGLSRSWLEPTDALFSDEGRTARVALKKGAA